jgi:hypothetical protein
MKGKSTLGTTDIHAFIKNNVPSMQGAALPPEFMPNEPAAPGLSGMPPEIIDNIGRMADPAAIIALSGTNKKNHGALRVQMSEIRNAQKLNAAIRNIQDSAQYNQARNGIAAIDPSFRADLVDALARKSNVSGTNPVRTFFDLAEMLKGAFPDSRGNAIRTLSDLISTLEARNVPLVRDQERAFDTLLAMAKEMSGRPQHEILSALSDAPAPERSRAKARAALSERG